MLLSDLTFGIEVECASEVNPPDNWESKFDGSVRYLVPSVIRCCYGYDMCYYHRVMEPDHPRFDDDGFRLRITESFYTEHVSPVLDYLSFRQELINIPNWIGNVNETCGLHVHVGNANAEHPSHLYPTFKPYENIFRHIDNRISQVLCDQDIFHRSNNFYIENIPLTHISTSNHYGAVNYSSKYPTVEFRRPYPGMNMDNLLEIFDELAWSITTDV